MKSFFQMTRALVARKRKIFALFFALAASIGLSWATTVTWDNNTLSSIYIRDGQSFTKDGVTLTALDGMIAGMDGAWMGNSDDASYKFSTSLGNFTKIEITADINELGGSGWTETSPGTVWTGDANETTFGGFFENVTQVVFTIAESTVAVTGVTLNKSAAELTVGGENLTLIPTVLPDNATNKEVMWTSDNGYVAVVENGGVVRPVGPGTANITVTTVDGDYSATCVVTVTDAAPAPVVDVKLPGKFSVSASQVVYFSRGNLQYTKSTGKWKIMDHQYDVVETLSQNVGTDYASQDVITLFGWGTSGWDNTAADATSVHYQPYSTSNTNHGTAKNNYQYGPSNDNVVGSSKAASAESWSKSDSYKNYDWGVKNSSDLGSGWRVLTTQEWGYLFNTRTPGNSVNGVSNARYTEATINTDGTAVNGIILFPDDAVLTSVSGVTWGTINGTSAWGTTCTTAGWEALEAAGCVFLPAASYRNGTSVYDVRTCGFYWSSSAYSATYAYGLYFYSGSVGPQEINGRYDGHSVRLVSETAPSGGSSAPTEYNLTITQKPMETIDAGGLRITIQSEEYAGLIFFINGITEMTLNKTYELNSDMSKFYSSVTFKDDIREFSAATLTKTENAGLVRFTGYAEDTNHEWYFTFDYQETSGGSAPTVTWNSSNISDLYVYGTGESYSKEGVTLSANAGENYAMWYDSGEESSNGIGLKIYETGGFTFSNTLGKNFTKIEMFPVTSTGWDNVNLGSGWSFSGEGPVSVTWKGNASTVDLLKDVSEFYGEYVNSIVFYFEGDSEEPGGGSTDVIPCTAADLGKVLCTDGSIYATVSEASAANKTAAAVIAYVDTENGKALALALADDGGEMDWATAKTTAPAHTPAVSGGTWTLASQDDWNNMITAAGGYTALRDGFSAVGGTNMKNVGYWSSTSFMHYAWCYKFNNGEWFDDYQDAENYVRACLAFDIPATPAYETVMNLINEIPNPVVLTAECKAKIDAARAAFIALSDGDKAQVTNYETLTTAEAAFDNVMDIWLSGDCDAILWKDTTLTIRKHAGEGNGAMADYTSYYGDNTAPWFNSHWYNPKPNDIVIKSVKIEEGVTRIGDYAFGWMSELKTLTIPSSVTSIGEDAFYWSKAVDDIYLTVANPSNLTWVLPHSADNQFKPEKATLCHVPADLLTAYQETFGTLNMTFVGDLDPITPLTPEQQQALDAAKDKIAAIPSPVVYTPACKDAIDAARAAYDALTPDMLKQLVSNYATLTAAEATYENLKDVVVVEAKINEIPSPMTAENTKLSVYNKVTDARAAYDALTADQQALVSNYSRLTDAEAAFAAYAGGGSAPAGALNGKFTINAGGDQIAFAKGNLQATTTDLGAHWTWGFAANQWDYLGIAVANSKINGNGTVSENGTVDLFGWSTAATYYGINNSYKAVDYIGDFVDWGPNMGAGWRTLTKDEWNYLIENNTKGRATVNDKNGYIFLPNDWSGPAFTPDPDNFTTNVYSGDDWTAMENAGAVFLPSGPARNGKSALIANDAKYSSSTSLNNDSSYVFTIYYNQSQSACTGTNRAYGCMVRLVTAGGASPIADAQAAKDLIDAIGEVSYPGSKEAIKAAREAVDALGANASLLDDADLNKLTQAEAAYAQLLAQAVAAVKDQIDALPDTPLTDATKKLSEYNKVLAAREAYDALSDEEKAAVTNYEKLTAAEAAFAAIDKGGITIYDSGSVALTDLKIGDVLKGGVTLIGEASDNIGVRRVAMNGEQKEGTFYILPFEYMNPQLGENAAISHGPNVFSPIAEDGNAGDAWIVTDKNAQATVWLRGISSAALPSVLADAQAALDKINAIPQPVVLSDDCNAAIQAARDAVTALGENASLLDDADIDKLAKAEADFALLIKDATAVADMIDAIGEVTFSADSKGKIADAREAYEALSDELKPYVSNLGTLTAAEAAYEAARPFAPVTTVPAAVEALQYTGAAQALITAGAAEHGTVLYSLDGENYSTELPTALLPGAYTIYYKVQATDDYKDVAPVTVIATIAYHYPATYSLFGIPEGWSVKVNDEEVAVVNGAVQNIAANDRFDIMPVKPEDVKLVEVVPYLLDLATVTDSVIYILDGDSITGTANGHISVVIVPDAKVYFKDVNLTNTGSHPAVLCGGNAEIVVVGENTITCTKEGEYGIRAAGAGTTLTVSGDKTLLKATIDPNGGTVNQ